MHETDDNFEMRLREIDKLRMNRKPTAAEVDQLVDKLIAEYPDRVGRINWQAAHLYGQSGIGQFPPPGPEMP
jgi:hypothetical protein